MNLQLYVEIGLDYMDLNKISRIDDVLEIVMQSDLRKYNVKSFSWI